MHIQDKLYIDHIMVLPSQDDIWKSNKINENCINIIINNLCELYHSIERRYCWDDCNVNARESESRWCCNIMTWLNVKKKKNRNNNNKNTEHNKKRGINLTSQFQIICYWIEQYQRSFVLFVCIVCRNAFSNNVF